MSVSVPAADAFHSHSSDGPSRSAAATTTTTTRTKGSDNNKAQLPTLSQEVYLFTSLAGPTILISIGFVVPSFCTAAYIGRHFGTIPLDAYTLANLTGNLCCLSLLAGLYSAADTLCPQAYGAGNFRQVGLVAMQALVTSWLILIPTNILLCTTLGPLLQALGQDAVVADLAWQFYNVYVWSLPFYAVWCVVWKFLSAQHALQPLVIVTLLASTVVLPISLEILGNLAGILGAAAALVVFQLFQVTAVLTWIALWPPHNPATWPKEGYAWHDIFASPAYAQFLRLGCGGMLASLEWIYWEAISLVVGLLGVVPLSVHTIPTQVIYVVFMFPLGMGVAISNRIGVTLSHSVARAKTLTVAILVVSSVGFGIFTWLLFVNQEFIFALFTNDPDVLAGCAAVWPLVCLYFWVLNLFGINTGIATGLGMQMTLGMWTLLFLWCLGLPASYYFAICQDQGLKAVWTWIIPPYVLIDVTMLILFYFQDWEEIATLVRIREGLQKQVDCQDETLESLHLMESFKHGDTTTTYGSTNA